MSGVVIVGAGQAAAVATRTLRRRGYDGAITLLGEEPYRPYQRPPLSKEFLTEGDESGLDLLPEEWTTQHEVTVRTGTRVLRIDPADSSVLLADDSVVKAEHVLLATGGRARRLPEAEGDRIRYLRTRDDADALRDLLGPGARLVVIGAGFIGAEVASSAARLGADVVVLEAARTPLENILGARLGSACARLYAGAGVDLRVGAPVSSVIQKGDEVLVNVGEDTLTADLVVVGIGIVPNVEVARDSGLSVDNGVLVDGHCRTSQPHVYAAGDVANLLHPRYGSRIRVEHFDNASKQGAVAANNILGRDTLATDPHWFWSDQFGVNLQYAGHADPSNDLVIRGSLDDPDWSAFFLEGGRLRAVFAVDRPEDVMVARALIEAGVSVTPDQLSKSDVDLMELMELMEQLR